MLQNLQNIAIFQKLQLDNLVDFEKCCKTHIYLQKSVPIQPKTSSILPKNVARFRSERAPPLVGPRARAPSRRRDWYREAVPGRDGVRAFGDAACVHALGKASHGNTRINIGKN